MFIKITIPWLDIIYPEDGGRTYLHNIWKYPPDYRNIISHKAAILMTKCIYLYSLFMSTICTCTTFSSTVVFNLGECENILHINQNETQEPLEPWTSSDPSSYDEEMPETSSNF
jgi:hypothetical protein